MGERLCSCSPPQAGGAATPTRRRLARPTVGDRLIVIAANAGATKNPDWYYNLAAHPQVTVEIGQETFPAVAAIVEGEKRERYLTGGRAARRSAFELDDAKAQTPRRIPVIALQRL